MVIRSGVDNILIATNGTNGQPGTPGTSSYIHIKYSNDGGITFTSNNGETIGAYIGIYRDYTEQDSSSVSAYQWKKIEGEDGEPAYTVMLSNENFSISTDTSYVPIHTQSFTCNVTVLKGSSPASFTITASTDTENDIVTTVNGHAVNITVAPVEALSATQGVITLTISTTEGHSFTKDITWSVATQGRDGQSGANGVSINDVVNYYLITIDDTPVTKQDSGWSTTIQSMTEHYPYLWTYEVIIGSDGSTISSTEPMIIGRYGRDGDAAAEGRGILSIAEHYQVSSSNTTPPTTWSDTPVTTDSTNKYLWNYETITYTDNTSEDTQKRVIGTHGTPGTPGTSITISSTSVKYAISASSTQAPTEESEWGTTVKTTTVEKQYLWTRTIVTYSDNTSTTSYSVARQGIDGTNGTDGKPGKDGKDGTSTYVHIKYSAVANPTDSDLTESPSDYIGICNDSNIADPTTASSYTWSKWQGHDGQNGQPGAKGEDGTNSYIHFAYSSSSDGSADFSTTSFDGAIYIGILVDDVLEDSLDYEDYEWSLIKGADGTSVEITSTSVQYAIGVDGTTVPNSSEWGNIRQATSEKQYLWTRTIVNYSDNTQTTSYSVARQGLDGTNGEDGQPGTNGRDGTSTYVHIKYSAVGNPTDADLTEIPSDYIGICHDSNVNDPTTASSYAWSKWIGEDGADGKPGKDGVNGTSSYTHFAYANSADGSEDFSTSSFSNAKYIGIRVDDVQADSTNYLDYTWNLIKGADGEDGVSVTVSSTQYQSGTSNTTPPTGSWSNSPVAVSAGNYLWTKVTYSDGKTAYSVARQGINGTSVTVSNVEYAYQLSTSGTTIPTGTWQTTPQAPTTTQYAWTRTTTTFSDGSTAVTYTVGGKVGQTGGKGDDGRGIVSITEYFLLSATDNVNQITFPEVNNKHGWTTVGEALVWSKTKPYLWHCTEVVYDNPSSTVYIDKYCDTSWKAADLVQANLTDFQQGVDNIIDRDNQSIRSAVWENTYTYKPKKDNQGNYMYDDNGKIIPDIDNATTMSEYMAEQIVNMEGITSRVTSSESDIDGIDGRLSTAESTITQHATDIEAKVSKNGVIAAINLSTETEGGSTAKISADKVEINGTAIFNSISDDVNSAIEGKGYATTTQAQGYANTAQQNAIAEIPTDISELNNDAGYQTASDVSGAIVSTTTLYYASNSTTPPNKPTSHVTTNSASTRGAWNISLPSYNASYPYLYICTEAKTKGDSYYWTSVEQTAYASAISSIKSTADAASPKSSAIARSQRIYYRKTTSGAPSKNTTWLATSGTGYGNWSLSVPQLTDSNGTKYLYLYTAVQTQTVAQQAAGTACTCSDVLIDDTATIIDGGTIITGTVTAREITADNLQGDHGWINLKDGKFYYGDDSTFAASDNAISWNGSKLQIKADEFLLASGKSIFDEIEAIETWFYNTAPTTSNAPASSWTTDNLKEMHLRDIYFDTSTGKSYRWAIDGTTYKWVEIEDKELSALAGRVSTAETNIQTNSEQIALRATKTEVANTYATKASVPTNVTDLDDADDYATKEYADDAADTAEANAKSDTATKLQSYYTKTETDSAISQTAEGITTRVSKLETRSAGNYATSSTATGTAAKTATIIPTVTGWELYNGAVVTVKFTNSNTTTSPTLNINSTGAKPIKTYSGGNLSEAEYKWDAGATMSFVYDGTNWRIQDSSELTRIKSAETSITENAEAIALRATKTEVSNAVGRFATSTTAKGTAAKVATITPAVTGWALTTGAIVTVKFTNENTATTPTLNVNSTGAKTIKAYTGTAALTEAEYKWKAGTTLSFVYDGSYWRIQDSTTASRLSSAESSITANTEAIALRVTSTDLTNAIDQEVTNRNAAIVAKANEITSSVSETYATKTSVPTKTSDLTNDSDFATESYADGKASAAETAAKGYADTQINSAESRIEQTTSSIATRVTKTEAKISGHYATCSTGAGTAAKGATITPATSDWELYTGASVTVKFSNANTTASPTLNVNSKGAKAIKSYTGANLSEAEYKWSADATLTFVYNGSNWLMQDGGTTARISSAESSITQQAGEIAAKVSKDGVIAAINLSTETEGGSTVKISADKVNIEGATIFTSGRLSSDNINSTIDSRVPDDISELTDSTGVIPTNTSDLNNDSGFQTVNDVNEAINNIEIGGRNLLLDTATSHTSAESENGDVYVASWKQSDYLTNTNLVVDETVFTISFDYEVVNNSASDAYFYPHFHGNAPTTANVIASNTNRQDSSKVYMYANDNPTGHYWITFKYTTAQSTSSINLNRVRLRNASDGATMKISNLKLEFGTKATDWTPAPEDVDGAIDIVQSNLNSTRSWYAECLTEANIAAKEATITPATTDFALATGTTVAVKFAKTNTVASPTLNVNGTGAIAIMRYGTTAPSTSAKTSWQANSINTLTYDGTYWRLNNWLNDDTTYNLGRNLHATAIKVLEAVPSGYLMAGTAIGYNKIVAGLQFSLSYPLLYASAAYTANTTYTNTYETWNSVTYTTTATVQSAEVNKTIYLKGTVSANTFTIDSTNVFTTVEPTSADGCFYIPLGVMSNATTGVGNFSPSNSLYAFIDGRFRQVTPTEIVASHRVYYRTASSSKPAAPTSTWVAEATNDTNTYNDWTTKVPPLAASTASGQTKYLYLYTCEQRKRLDGTIQCTDVQLDENTTVIDGGNIITGTVTANQIAANSISAVHLNIGDSTNLAQANENIPNSLPGQIWNGESYVSDGTSYSDNYKLKIFEDENTGEKYLIKKDLRNPIQQNYMMFTDFIPSSFRTGDELYYEFTAKAASATTIAVVCWGYTAPYTSSTCSNYTSSLSLTTSEQTFSGTIELTNTKWDDTAKYYLLGFNNNASTKVQIFVKKVIFRKKNGGELIVDGSITTNQLNADNINTSKILTIGAFQEDTQEDILNSRRNLLLKTAEAHTSAGSESGNVYITSYAQSDYLASQTLVVDETILTLSFDYEVVNNSAADAVIWPHFHGNMPTVANTIASNANRPETNKVYMYVNDNPSGHYWVTFKVSTAQLSGSANINRVRLRYATDGATLKISNMKLEFGNKVTGWSPAPEDVDKAIDDASKVAANYIVADSTGLMVADMSGGAQTPSTATTNNVLIDSDSVDIRNGQTTLASFSASTIELGKNNANAEIQLCHGNGVIKYDSTLNSGALTIRNNGGSSGSVLMIAGDGESSANIGVKEYSAGIQATVTNLLTDQLYLANFEDTIQETYIMTDIISAFNKSIPQGTIVTSAPAAVNVATSTNTTLGNITLAAGTWIVVLSTTFASNSTGRRVVYFTNSSSTSSVGITQSASLALSPADGAMSKYSSMDIVSPTAQTTYYCRVWQNSGSSLSCQCYIRAVRIA